MRASKSPATQKICSWDVADKVFLLTPRNVEVSAEERVRTLERGGFFNQA